MRRILWTMSLLNSAIHGKSSQGISRMFNISKPPTSSRRQILRIDFKGNKSRTATTFSVNATEQFNMLPNELKNPATTQNQFKRNIKQHAMSSLHLSQHWDFVFLDLNRMTRKWRRRLLCLTEYSSYRRWNSMIVITHLYTIFIYLLTKVANIKGTFTV